MRQLLKSVFLVMGLLAITYHQLGIPSVFAQAAPVPPVPPPGDPLVESVLKGLQLAHAAGATPIIRNDGGFELNDPVIYAKFLKDISAKVDFEVYALAGPNEPESERWAAPNCGDGDGICVGGAITGYVNAVIAKKGDFPNVKLLSPAFNLCSYVFPGLIGAMGGVQWGGLDGIAANVYNEAPAGAESTISSCLNNRLPMIPSSLPVIITETGAYSKTGNPNYNAFYNEINNLNPRVIGALLFNGFNTNPGWAEFSWDDPHLVALCAGNCAAKRIGVNHATIYTSGDYAKAGQYKMKYTLEIVGFGGGLATAPTGWDRLTKPCPYIANPEHHPLRPYPFNPCDPLIPQYNSLTFQCGNALDVNGNRSFPTLYIDEADALGTFPGSMAGLDDPMSNIAAYESPGGLLYKKNEGGQLKVYAVQRIPFDVEVELTTAQMPVIGNTQIALDDATNMNNYLSWYLNGAVQHSERKKLDNVDRLINFSGPIKKMLSQSSQQTLRKIIVKGVGTTDIHNYLVGGLNTGPRMTAAQNALSSLFQNIPLSSMEDTVGEAEILVQTEEAKQPGPGSGPIGGQSKIFIPPNNSSPINPNSMKLYIKKSSNPGALPNLSVGSDGRLYLPHLRETLALTDIIHDYASPYYLTDPNAKKRVPLVDSDHFDIGLKAQKYFYGTPDKNLHKGLQDDVVVQVTFDAPAYGETPTRNTEIIDNPASAGNSTILRHSVDVSGEFKSAAPGRPTDDLGNALGPHIEVEPGFHQVVPSEIARSSNAMCGLQAVALPGDNVVDAKGWKIVGRLTYTAIFSYNALKRPPEPNVCGGKSGGTCPDYHDCVKPSEADWCRGSTNPQCGKEWGLLDGTCVKKPSVGIGTSARTTVVTETPFIDHIYGTLISNQDSFMRRFLPQKNPDLAKGNTCSTEYLLGEDPNDNPKQNPVDSCVKNVSTQVYYGSASGQTSPRHPNAPGGGAKEIKTIYFPYLGSLYDYFLGAGCDQLNFQKMFRPKDAIKPCANAGPLAIVPKKMVALVLGQSNAGNYGDVAYSTQIPDHVKVLNPVSGALGPANDPLLNKDGAGGSPWARLGDLVVRSKLYDDVVIIPVTQGSTQVSDWVPGTSLNNQIMEAIATAQSQNLVITHILWHQGETDAAFGTSQRDYQARLLSVIQSIRTKNVSAPFYVAQATRCDPLNGTTNPTIHSAQAAMVDLPNNIFAGPDTDLLKAIAAYRGGPGNECHFSGPGLDAHAAAWLAALQKNPSGTLPPVIPTGNYSCAASGSPFCTPGALVGKFGENADKASVICQAESGGIPTNSNHRCLRAPGSGYTRDYSVGLFQINLLAHPNKSWLANSPDALTLRLLLAAAGQSGKSCYEFIQDNNPNSCVILNQTALDICEAWFMIPANNAAYAAQMSGNGENWGPWSTKSCLIPKP